MAQPGNLLMGALGQVPPQPAAQAGQMPTMYGRPQPSSAMPQRGWNTDMPGMMQGGRPGPGIGALNLPPGANIDPGFAHQGGMPMPAAPIGGPAQQIPGLPQSAFHQAPAQVPVQQQNPNQPQRVSPGVYRMPNGQTVNSARAPVMPHRR